MRSRSIALDGDDVEPGPHAAIVTLKFDRPFLCVIREVATGAILFLGPVVDPGVGR